LANFEFLGVEKIISCHRFLSELVREGILIEREEKDLSSLHAAA